MFQRDNDIHASAPLQAALGAQTAWMMQKLQRCAGEHALLLCASKLDRAPVLPLLGHWVRLELSEPSWRGDLAARVDESLPFVDDAFDLLLLRHAFEAAASPRELLRESIRLLAPGGTLVISGLHPLGLWAPWFHWRSRGRGLHLLSPTRLAHWLSQSGMLVEQVQRIGHAWPSSSTLTSHGLGGGSYVLIARKQRRMAVPLKPRAHAQRTPVNARLSAGARRHSTH